VFLEPITEAGCVQLLKELDILGVCYALFVYVLCSSQLLFSLLHFSFAWNTQVNLLYSNVIVMPSTPLECCRRHSVYAQFLCLTMIICWKLVSTISYKPVVGISPNLQLRCSWL